VQKVVEVEGVQERVLLLQMQIISLILSHLEVQGQLHQSQEPASFTPQEEIAVQLNPLIEEEMVQLTEVMVAKEAPGMLEEAMVVPVSLLFATHQMSHQRVMLLLPQKSRLVAETPVSQVLAKPSEHFVPPTSSP